LSPDLSARRCIFAKITQLQVRARGLIKHSTHINAARQHHTLRLSRGLGDLWPGLRHTHNQRESAGEREIPLRGCKSNINSAPGKSPGSCKMHRGIVSTTISVAESCERDRERERAQGFEFSAVGVSKHKRRTLCRSRRTHQGGITTRRMAG
jgi:hypothetical protein